VSGEQVILLLGRRDHPTDGVADYCEQLREYGAARGLSFESVQVPWAEKGWQCALAELRKAAAAWRDRWVLLQYTTLAWSYRGFPLRAPRVLKVLRQAGVRCGVVLHDFSPWEGNCVRGSLREYCQLHVLRQLYARSDLAIFTGPVENLSWLPKDRDKATFIPVGANCPELAASALAAPPDTKNVTKTIAVYGVTGGSHTLPEVADIAFAVKRASQTGSPLRLLVFGRGSNDAESALRSELAGVNVDIETLGLVSPEQVSEALAKSDVLLFVRGQISSRRGSAIAGIACGLPIVCYSGPETVWPVTDAGILAASMGDRRALAVMLQDVLTDERLRSTLRGRSRRAHDKYFSWTAITARYATAFGKTVTEDETNVRKKPPGERQVA
jgi:glycosyltransferase involved in cell wall biosynthesis